MFSVTLAKIVGSASEKRWSQVHTFRPAGEKVFVLGELFLVVGLDASEKKGDDLDIASFGKEFIQRFHEQYYGSEDGSSVLKHISKAVKEIVGEFGNVKVELVAGAIVPTQDFEKLGVLYLASIGGCSALLIRKQKAYKLIDGRGADFSEPVCVNGFVENGDMIFLGTGDFFKLVSEELLESAYKAKGSAEVSSIFAPHVHESENSGVAAIIALVGGEDLFDPGALTKDDSQISERSRFKKMNLLKSFSEKIRDFRNKVGSLFGKSRQQEIIVREENERQKRLMLSVAFGLLLLLGVSVFFGWKRRLAQEMEERFSSVWEVVDHQYKEALSLTELNPLRARALLIEAKKNVEEIIADERSDFSGSQNDKLSKRLDELTELIEQVSGEHKIKEASVFLDLSLVRPDTYGEVLALHEDTMVVLDRSSGVLLRVSVGKKSAEVVGGGSFLSGASVAAVYSGKGFVLSKSGMVEVSLSRKTSAIVFETDPEWGEIVDIEIFGGNIYLLDKGQGEIFRYQGAEGKFGERQRWLGQGVFPDFSSVRSLVIDGDIWVLDEGGIFRFRRGAAEPFVVTGLDKPLADPVSIDTDEDSDLLYILDRGNDRVLVLNKSGEYKEQYVWDGIEGVTDMVVSEEEGKILLLSGSIVYEIKLER